MHGRRGEAAGPRDHDERLVVLGRLDAVGLRVRERRGLVAGAARLLMTRGRPVGR